MLYVGTSGWQYRHWRETFYPKGVAQRAWLPYFAARFQTVELNNSFYHLPEKSSFESWREATPRDFIVAVKASRFLTHIKRLKDPEEPAERFMERASALGPKLGPVLLQLPPRMKVAEERLLAALSAFPRKVRLAVEFRDDSWFTPGVRSALERRGAALCLADSPKRQTPAWRTADWGFVRLHEGTASPHPCYGRRTLAGWAERIAEMWPARSDVFVYFNNDGRACAIRDAIIFARAAKKVGLKTTRVPDLGEVRIG